MILELGTPADLRSDRDSWSRTVTTSAAKQTAFVCSPFLSFRGGKGVATGFGAMVAMNQVLTIPALTAMVVWYATVRLSRYVSVASMLAALSLPVWYLLLVIPSDAENHSLGYTLEHIGRASPPLVVTALLAGLVIYKHRSNLIRLRRGEEPKISDRSGTR